MTREPNPVREGGAIDTLLAKLRHHIAYRKLKPHMPLNCCLDIGSGAHPLFLLRLQARHKYGIEQSVSDQSAREASAFGIRLLQCNLSGSSPLPFEDDFFDAVTMLAVIEHLEPARVQSVLSEIRRTLRPGGVFVLTVPAAWTNRLLHALAGLRLISRQEIDDHKDTFTRHKLRVSLQRAGFQKVQTGAFECYMNLWARCSK